MEIDFKTLFKSWGFDKEHEEDYFKTELSKLKYVNGSLYWDDGVINE